MVAPERLNDDVTGPERYGHEARYLIAHGLTIPGDTVLDAACGTGYGATILAPHGSGVHYFGIDIKPVSAHTCPTHRFVNVDLQEQMTPIPFDVAVSFETIEHLPDYLPLIATLKSARRWIIASVPIVPTVGVNPFHRHDFVPGQLAELFVDDEWELFQTVQQPSEVSEIGVFRHR